MRNTSLRSRGISFLLIAAVSVLGLQAPPAAGQASSEPRGQKTWENHCRTPFGGLRGGELVDLNEVFARTEAFVHPRYCPKVDAGEQWIVGRGCVAYWFTNTEHANYPPGYVPTGDTPMEDFLSKMAVKVVVDDGTRQERTYLYRYVDDPSIAAVMATGPNPLGIPEHLPLASLIPRNAPLPIGTHTVDLYLVMSEAHWDGLGMNPEENMLPAGETLITAGNRFEVVARSGNVSPSS